VHGLRDAQVPPDFSARYATPPGGRWRGDPAPARRRPLRGDRPGVSRVAVGAAGIS
jgi:hypothetical protein